MFNPDFGSTRYGHSPTPVEGNKFRGLIDPSLNFNQRGYLNNRYIVWRHGQSEANVAERIVSKIENGADQFGLTPVGFEQVRLSATQSRNMGIDNRSLLFSSPFLRCVQTAQEIASRIGASGFTVVRDLRERDFGIFEGASSEAYKLIYDLDRAHPGHKLYGVESTHEVLLRIARLVNALEREHDQKTLVLVTHADVGEILQATFSGLAPERHRDLPKLKNAEAREVNLVGAYP